MAKASIPVPVHASIGQAAAASGVSAKMIRHYEELGLLPKARRTDAGYRIYDEAGIHQLRFIRRARDLGFDMKEIRRLLDLWRDRGRASSEVRALTRKHIEELDRKIEQMRSMRDALEDLARCCRGDHRPECPILSRLSGE